MTRGSKDGAPGLVEKHQGFPGSHISSAQADLSFIVETKKPSSDICSKAISFRMLPPLLRLDEIVDIPVQQRALHERTHLDHTVKSGRAARPPNGISPSMTCPKKSASNA